MSVAQRILVNPANTSQRYIFWSNGMYQNLGGALPVAQAEQRFGEGAVAPNAPTFYEAGGDPCNGAQIISWATPSGYTMDIWGTVYPWGGATAPSTQPPNVFLFQPTFGFYNDFVMDPAGNGNGYILNYDGDLIAFGTGTPAVAHSAFLAGTGVMAMRVVMDWTSKRYWVIDSLGRIWGKNAGSDLALDGLPALGFLGDQLRYALVLYDKTAAGKGWALNQYGLVTYVGGAQDPKGSPYNPNARMWQDIAIINDGTGANPLRLVVVNEFGQQYEWLVSTAPTVVVTKPDDPTTTTSRPLIAWTVSDAEGDAVASWDLAVFTAAQYGIVGFDPAVSPATYRFSGTDANTRNLQIPQDLANATYRAYVRATDTSALTSAWAFKQWVQNVVRPVTPTVTPTVLGATTGISLLIHTATLITNGKFGVQYHDADWDGVTWNWVQNGWDLTPDGSGNSTVVDHGAGYGVQRTYRAIYYVYTSTTNTWNGSDFSATANATISDKTKWVLSTADGADELTVKVQPNIKFTKSVRAGVFWPAGRSTPIVVRDTEAKAAAIPISLWVFDNATRLAVEALFKKEVLLLRDPFGHRYYVATVEDQVQEPLRATPLVSETTPIRDANQFSASLQEVSRPKTGPLVGPLAV